MLNHPCSGCKFDEMCGEKKLACKSFFQYCEMDKEYSVIPDDDKDPCKYYYAMSFPNDVDDFETMKLRLTNFDIWRRSDLYTAPVHPDFNSDRKTKAWFKNVVLAANEHLLT